MIFYIWVLWAINIIYMQIMLLNFLIAIISQSYDKIIAAGLVVQYKARCQFNAETAIIAEIISNWKGEDQEALVFGLSSNMDEVD